MKRIIATSVFLLGCFCCTAQQFVFFTDSHVEKDENSTTAVEMDRILTGNSVKTVIFGGDGTMTCEGCRTKEDIDESWRRFDYVTGVIRRHGCNFYLVRGNHEVTTGTIDPDVAGFTYSQREVYKMLRSRMADVDVTELGNGTLTYFFDDALRKVRFIILDPYSSADTNQEKRYGVRMENNEAATVFLENSLKSQPAGFKAVIILHQGMNKCTGIGDFGNVRKMLELVNANSGKVAMVLHGHVHKDVETFEHGVLHVSTTSSNCHQHKAGLYGIEGRTYDSPSETAIDLVDMNLRKGRIEMKRTGGGYSRYFNLKPIKMKAGKTVRIRSSLESVTDWMIYDSDGIKAPSWVDWETQAVTVSTRAEFAGPASGVSRTVRGLGEGESVVVAYNRQTRERELFYIVCQQ